MPGHAGSHGKGTCDVVCALRTTERVLRHGALSAHQDRRHRQPEMPARDPSKHFRLVEAAFAPAFRVDGHRHQGVTTNTDPPPASGQQNAQRLRQTAFSVVLQGVQRGACRAGERCAPLELHEPARQRGGQADGHAGRFAQPPLQEAAAAATEDLTFLMAAGTARRQEQVEEGAHAAMVGAGA